MLCESLPPPRPRGRVNIVSPGYFGWPITTSLSHFAPAIETGLAEVRRKYPHLNWTSEFLLSESFTDCFTLRDNIQYELAKWYYTKPYGDDVLTVIITPGCFESRYLSELAGPWDLLLITSVDYTERMRYRQEYPSYVTTSPLTPVNGVIYCALFATMQWTKLYLLHDTSGAPYYTFQASVLPLSIPANCKVQLTRQQFASNYPNVSQQLQPILRDFNSKSRVLLYFGNATGLRILLIEAEKLNMTSGEHLFVAVTPLDYTAYGNFTWQNMDNDDETVRRAYRAVLLIRLVDITAYSTPPIRRLVQEWRALALNRYNNTELRHNLILPAMMAAYTAVELLAEAIQSASPGGWTKTPPSGKFLADQLLNHTFNLQVGSVRMLGQGQLSHRHLATCFDFQTGCFRTCLISRNTPVTEHLIWERVQDGRWFDGDSFPPNEPVCGFDGHRNSNECTRQSAIWNQWSFGVGLTLLGLVSVSLLGAFLIRRHLREFPSWELNHYFLDFQSSWLISYTTHSVGSDSFDLT
ncbi:hypothetical protein BV898_15861 [Hypsibius exemplaris]|uniref:Receptor ligand binding region domain-containing protein n=1 Tax=Hypsibius exemplaris TaxID=2072580 RepID=A0A9X6NEP6_HYPEX|nr:hypothetical protein BV898_15861 [Hypsibius exemplaris]